MKKKSRKPANDAGDTRLKILDAVLAQVPFDGWTHAAYERGIRQCGLTPGEADLLFPRGVGWPGTVQILDEAASFGLSPRSEEHTSELQSP